MPNKIDLISVIMIQNYHPVLLIIILKKLPEQSEDRLREVVSQNRKKRIGLTKKSEQIQTVIHRDRNIIPLKPVLFHREIKTEIDKKMFFNIIFLYF